MLLPFAILGTVSTAGFCIFVVVAASRKFFVNTGSRPELAILKQILGVLVTSAAVWIAFFAPVVGLLSKRTVNEVSLTDRQVATEAGIRALSQLSIIGEGGTAINLIASIAAYGLAYAILIMATIATLSAKAPVERAPRGCAAGIVVIAITLLFSQPPHDATVAFCLLILCAAPRRQFQAIHRPSQHLSIRHGTGQY
jgi:hypothetical protein